MRRRRSESAAVVPAVVQTMEPRVLLSSAAIVGNDLVITGAAGEANNFTISFNNGTNRLDIIDTAGNNLSVPVNGSANAAAIANGFSIPLGDFSGSVIFNCGDQNDTVNVGNLGAAMTGLTINGDAGADTVNFTANTIFAGGKSLTVAADTINTAAGVQLQTKNSAGGIPGNIGTPGDISFTADVMTLSATSQLISQDTVTLKQQTNARLINLGSAVDNTANTLELSSAELGIIQASKLVIGDTNSGDLTISADFDLTTGTANVQTLRLNTAGKVTGAEATGGIIVGNLAISAGDVVSLTDTGTNISNLAVVTTNDNVTFVDSSGFAVNQVDGISGVNGAVISLTALTGNLTVNDTGAANDVNGTGLITFTLSGNNAVFTLDAGTDVETTAGGVTLLADKMALNGTITAATQTVTLRQGNGADAINLGSAVDTTANTLELSDAELDRVSAGTMQIGNNASGAITFSANIDRAAATNIGLTTAGGNNIALATFGLNANGGNITLTTTGAGAITTGDNTGTDLNGANVTLNAGTIGTVANNVIVSSSGTLTTNTNANNGAQFLQAVGTASVAGLNAGNSTVTLGGGTFNLSAANQVTDTTTVQVNAGTFGLSTFSDTVAQLIVNGGAVTSTTGVLTSTAFIDARSGSASAILAGAAGLTKSTNGTLALTGANTYTGATTVNTGVLNVNGSTAAGSAVTVNAGGTLGGTGTVNGTVTTAGTGKVAPGTSPGILNTGNATFVGTSSLDVEIGGATAGNAANNHDQLNVTGTVTLGGATLNLSAFNGFVPQPGQTFTILQNDAADAITGTFAGLAEGASIANFLGVQGLTAKISYVGGTGNDVVIQLPTLSPSIASGALTIADLDVVGKNNNITVSVVGNNLVLTDPNETFGPLAGATLSADGKTLTIPLNLITNGLIFNLAGGNDTLTLNLTNMNLTTLGGVTFNGGAGGNDVLVVGGGPAIDTVTHNFVNANDGSVVVSGAAGGTINYTGLDPIVDNMNAANRVFTFTGGAETITLEDSAGAQMKISSTLAESVTFNNPTASLTINAGTGDDIVNINSVDANGPYNVKLTINGDAANDTVNLNADITFAAGQDLIVNAETVNTGANADLITSGAGVITITADDVALNATSTLQSATTVTIKQQTAAREVDLGTNTAGKLSLTDAELDRISAQKLVIGDGSTGNITVTQDISPANISVLRLNNNGTVTATAGGIAVASLAIQTTGVVNITDANTNLTNLAVDTTNDNVTVVESNGFTVNAVDGLNGIDGAVIALTATTGDITVANTGNANDIDASALISFTLGAANAAFTINAGADVETTAGGVSITADNMALLGTITSANLTTTLKQQTAARVVSLGVETGGQLSLTDAELDTITAQKIVIGDAATGIINVAADIDTANTNLLRLNNNANVNATAGGIVETNLAIQTTGVVNITDTTTNVTNLAIITTNDNVTFVDADGFTVTAVDGLSGIDGAVIALTATTGNITVANTAAANDVNGTGAISFTLVANDAVFTIDATADVETTAGGVAVNADKMLLNGTITAAAQTVALKQGNGADAINLGSATDAAANTLELSDAELDRVTAGTLVIGDGTSGAITISADITRPAATVVNLTSGTDINITGGLLNTGGGNATLTTGAAGNVRVTKTGVDVNTGAGTLAINGGLAFTINGLTPDVNHDQLNVVGLLNLTNAKLAMTGTLVPKLEETVTLVNNDLADAITGVFTSITAGGIDENGGTLQEGNVITKFLGTDRGMRISYVGGTGNDVVLSHLPTIVEIDGNGDLIVRAEGGSVENLTFTLVDKNKSLKIFDPTGNVVSKIPGVAASADNTTVTVPLNLVTGDEIIVNTFGGDDIIRFGGGKFSKAIRLNGGTDNDDVRTTGALTITSSAALDNSLEVGSGGTARLGGAVTANRGVEVLAGDDVTFSGIKAGTLVNLNAGAGRLSQTGGVIQSAMAQLDGDDGVGSAGGFIKTRVTNIGAKSTNGGVFIQETDGVIVGGDPAVSGITAGGDIEFRARNIRTEDVLDSGGDMRIRAEGYTNINADVTATGTIWWRSVGGITQESGAITADGLAIASKTGSVILESATNNVNNFSASAKTKGKGVFYQDADDVTVSSFDSGDVFTTPIEGILAGGNIEILAGGNVILDGPVTADKAVRIETTGGDITQTANGRVKAKALGAKATGNVDLTGATNKVSQFASDAGGVAGTIDNVIGFSEGTLAAGRLVGEITTP